MMSSQSFRDVLNQSHTFPGEYVFRVIGANTAQVSELRAVLEAHLRTAGVHEFRFVHQHSAKGSYTAYRIFARVESAEQVVDLTETFQRTSGVRLVM
jgi:putative lipoic acid-binding regulatory protein